MITDAAFGYSWDRQAKINSQHAPTYTYIEKFRSLSENDTVPEWMGEKRNTIFSFGGCGSYRTACSIKDYCSPVLCLVLAKQRTPSPSPVAFYEFYDMPGKVWAASIFFVPVLAREFSLSLSLSFSLSI